MDFFEHQAEARKRTKLLVFYYALAVAMIIGAIYLVLAVGLVYSEAREQVPADFSNLWQPELFLWTAVIVGGIITLGTLGKISSLSGGGKSVARMMGGNLVTAETSDPAERQLLNIVEEMAIASGISVPPVYVIEEAGINAFAAGFKPSDAVIGVTRGSLQTLNRDELQGVIAHEFSHIINGDMRLNIRLIGVLFGILIITVIGQLLMRIGLYSGLGGRRRTSSRGGRGGGNGLPVAIMALGVCMLIIGSIGVFFGRLIKSAVSRQREFLADASAVQFTRNPNGIGGALKKIAGNSSRIDSIHAEEASHMFFANCLKSSLGGLLATHPPIQERIRRLEPEFAQLEKAEQTPARPPSSARTQTAAGIGLSGGETGAVNPMRLTALIGAMDAGNLERAAGIIKQIPESIRTAVRKPPGARAAVYCLLQSQEPDALRSQQSWLQEQVDTETLKDINRLSVNVANLPTAARIPLVDLTLTALQQQTGKEYKQFKKTVEQLIAADQKIGIFEFALSRILLRNLDPVFGRPEKRTATYHRIRPLIPYCLPLLSQLAHFGNEDDPDQAKADFAAGLSQLGIDPEHTPMPKVNDDPVKVFSNSLDQLQKADDKIKKQIVNGCVAAVAGNQKMTVAEAELLRAVVDSLGCPLPPLLSG